MAVAEVSEMQKTERVPIYMLARTRDWSTGMAVQQRGGVGGLGPSVGT